MSYKDLDAERRVQKCTLDVMTHPNYRTMAGILMMGSTTVMDDFPTAATDGLNKIYGRQFVMGLEMEELRFVILHEAMHAALRHLTTWAVLWKEDPSLANQACDYVVNILLVDSDPEAKFIQMPAVGLLDEKFRGMDSGEVFRLLKEKGDKDNKGDQGFDQHDWEASKSRTPAEQKQLEQTITEALQQGAVVAGKMTGNMKRLFDELRAPKVDWREQLREFVLDLCTGRDLSTWKKPNRRTIDSGIYMPSSYSETVGRIALGVDTSGSIGDGALTTFISEVVGLADMVNPELIDLLYWGTTVVGHEKYAAGQYAMLPQSTRPKGGGGTAPSCITQYMKEKNLKPECAIVLTDGVVGSDWGGTWPCPVLWVVVGHKRITAATGKTIHID